ncbi:hypothetical protein ACQY0O_001978 [Thecaphora frezii]
MLATMPSLFPPLRLALRSYSTATSSATATASRRIARPRRSKPSVFSPPLPKTTRNTPAPLPVTDWNSPLASHASPPLYPTSPPRKTYDPTLPPNTPQLPKLKQAVKALKLHLLPGGTRVSISSATRNDKLEDIKKERTQRIKEQLGGDYQEYTVEGLGKSREQAVETAKVALAANETLGKEAKKWMVENVKGLIRA